MSRNEVRGPLRPNPRNPRYFTDESGRAIYLTGSHTWNDLQDMGKSDSPPAFDFTWYLDFLQALNHNFIRLWTWDMICTWNADETVRPFPWARTGPGLALDGKPKFDLFHYDGEHFDRLRARVAQAAERGIYVSVMLFEGWSMFESNRTRRDLHLFGGDNNINGIDVLASAADNVLKDWVGLSSPEVLRAQEAYVRHVVETVNEFDNVLYEISNEAGQYSQPWQDHFVAFIRRCEADLPTQHPVGVTAGMGVQNEWLFGTTADWVSPDGWAPEGEANPYREGGYTWGAAAFDRGDKVVLLDTDHIWGIGGTVPWAWKSFCRGYQVLYMDRADDFPNGFFVHEWWPEPVNVDLRREMGRIRSYAERMDLNSAVPHNALASTGYCLAQPGVEYLVYQPEEGPFTIDLPAGAYLVEWHDPGSGEPAGEDTPCVGTGACRFEPPFTGEAVLYLRNAKR